jgi:hypothetical protein
MNEIDIIRSQLATEQSHAAEVANACAALLGPRDGAPPTDAATAPFREAGVSYLVWVLARFEERDQTLSELLAARASPAGAAAAVPREQALGELLSRSGRSREALSYLESALAGGEPAAVRARWQEFARFFNSAWTPRRAALEAALAAQASVADWRAVCAIDADSILDERRRYARVLAELPPGRELRGARHAGSP